MQYKHHICGSFPSLNNMYGSSWNSSFVIQELIVQHFFCFSKDKSPELQCHLEQDKQQLRLSRIISVNYQDLDQACATHEFQVQSKSLYQINFIQNSGEFEAENQVLERNYNRATIYHFHLRDYSKSSLFYSTLKNKLKQTRHTFLFFFNFTRSHIITITIYIYYIDNFLFCFSFIIF